MKMSSDFSTPTYSAETCDSFTVSSTVDTSLFETTPGWVNGSPTTSGFTQITSSTIPITSLSSSLKSLVLTSGSYSTTYTSGTTPTPAVSPTVTIVASTTVNQNYDLSTLIGATNYSVPAFTLTPPGSAGTIIYTNVSPVPGVTFDTFSRIYNWASLSAVGTYTLTM